MVSTQKKQTQQRQKQTAKRRDKTARVLSNIAGIVDYAYHLTFEDIYRNSKTKAEFIRKASALFKRMQPAASSQKRVKAATRLWAIYRAKLDKPAEQKGGAMMEGGPYLQRLTDKGDQPITGYDFAKALDEILIILSSLQYTKDMRGPLTLIDLTRGLEWFRGNDMPLKYYLRYYWAQKFYGIYPPHINVSEIIDRWDNLVDFVNMFTDDKRIRREWANEQGIPVKETEKDRFMQEFARKFDAADRAFMSTRMQLNLRNLMI
jgi:hypothetical protein